MSMKIINKKPIIRVEKSLIWAKLGTITQKTVSQKIRRIYLRGAFSALFYIFSELKNIKQVKNTFLPGFKKKGKTDQHVHNIGTGEDSLIILKEYQHWNLRKGGFLYLFSTGIFFTSGQWQHMYNVCLIDHKQTALVNIKFSLTHVLVRMPFLYLTMWTFLLSII